MELLPLVIGVTGHRDIRDQDREQLAETVSAVFDELSARYPNTPLIVVSALAEGADRIVAQEALLHGAKLVCPLPLPKDIYIRDFSTAGSRTEFESLLAQADSWFVLPLMDGFSYEDLVEHGPARDIHYAQCGAYLALRSQILLALWNGEQSNLIGGTAQTVRFKLQGVGSPYARTHSHLDIVDSGPVYHIVTPRKSQFNVPSGAFELRKLYPELSEAHVNGESFEQIYSRINEFNGDAEKFESKYNDIKQRSADYLLSEEEQSLLSKEGRAVLDLYASADSMSTIYQRSTTRTLRVLLWSVFLAAGFFHVYTHLYYKTPIFLLAYLVAFAFAYGWHLFASKKKLQSKYLEYRALAEGLRVQFFWHVAGHHDSVAFYYLRKQRSALDWVRHAIRASSMSIIVSNGRIPEAERSSVEDSGFYHQDTEDSLRLVRRAWVEDQANYFNRSAHREHGRLHRLELMINGALALGFILSVAQLLFPPNHVLWVVIGLLAVAAGMMHTYVDKRAFDQHAKQYQRMGAVFNRASEHLDELISRREYETAQEFIGELGREALIENGDWIHIHRDRPIEVPKGA
jgi:hypothetical protein